MFRLWQTFLNNVHPLTKILHSPSVQQLVLEASSDLENVSREVNALLFAIYSSAITSLSNSVCQSTFGESRSALLARYQLGARRALLKAKYLSSSELMTLQAYTVFLVSALFAAGLL